MKATKYTNPNFKFHTDSRSASLTPYLDVVHAGIVGVCNEFDIKLHQEDLQWLVDHGGRFQRYIHPHTSDYKKTVQSRANANKPIEEVKDRVLRTRHKILGEQSPRFSSRISENSYRDCMEAHLHQFWNFLAITGDYLSMLILLPHPPEHCPSVDYASVKKYVLHTFQFPNRPLYSSWDTTDQADRVKDINGSPMTTQGGKQCPTSFYNFFAALTALHSTYAKMQNSMYCNQCEACLSLYKAAKDRFTSSGNTTPHPASTPPCPCHTGQGPNRYIPYGNPMQAEIHKQVVAYVSKTCAERNWITKSAAPLLPCDMLKLHSYMASQNYSLEYLARYTMILGAIHCAGRFDEYSDIKVEHFNCLHNLFEIRNNKVVSIAQNVLGKTDKKWYPYRIAFADNCPKLCYLRHLLIYVHCLNLTSEDDSYVYPNPDAFINLDTSSPNSFVLNVPYEKFLTWMNDITGNPKDHIKPHSTRASFYLWWVLAGGNIAIAPRNARHGTRENSEKYQQDAFIQRDFILRDPFLRTSNPVPPAYDRLMSHAGHSIHRLNNMSMGSCPHIKTLREVASLYVTNTLLVGENSEHYRNAAYLLHKSYQTSSVIKSPYDELLSMISALPNETGSPMKAALQKLWVTMEHHYWVEFSKRYPLMVPTQVRNPNTTQTPSTDSPHHFLVIRKVPGSQHYTMETTNPPKGPAKLSRYMFDILLDVISLDKSEEKTNFQKFEDQKFKLDIGRSTSYSNGSKKTVEGCCRNFWRRKGMNNFGACLTKHYNMDYSKFWEEKGESFSTKYICSTCEQEK